MSFSPNSPAAPASADARLTLLKAWLAPLDLVAPESARPASSDASFRRYYRLDVLAGNTTLPGKTLIAMDAPPERENVPAFVKVAGLLKAAGVSVPEIIAQDLDNGFLLISDLGTTTYLDALNHDNASVLYAE
ncbi:MAG: phosphotransferase, partial [Janthinobacterium sp.]